ncbi:MAG: hypothetical protein M3003_04940 [Candidatus Dormibacteraeota bacterium]|nr:hypothetical protein [Candidatus Dormibacteraeota bacterium]
MRQNERDRIAAAFDRELERSPVPPGLRAQAVHATLGSRNEPVPERQPWALAVVAVLLAVAIVATIVLGARVLHSVPARPGPAPQPRAEASIAYDEARGQMVLFGGGWAGPANETWTWNGKSWTHQHPAISPPGRQQAAMAYDAARHRVVLFGGIGQPQIGNAQGELRDTWTWDGRSWRQEHTTSAPAFADFFTLGYDPISRLVIAVYDDSQPPGASHTWAWNGSDWMELHTTTKPPAAAGSLVSDGSRLLLIALPFGPEGGRYFSQTWAWDGSDWKRLNPHINLPATGLFQTAFDEVNGKVVAVNADTWTWNGSTWSRQHPSAEPAGGAYVVYLPPLRKVIAWGDRYDNHNGDLWAWDGSNWTLISGGPPVPTPLGNGYSVQGTMSPADAEALIRKTVTSVHPVLVPGRLPSGLEAQVGAGADGYSIQYQSDQRDRTITFGIVVPQPPPVEHAVMRTLTFRGVTATYQVNDPGSPLSGRWLMWNERGTMADSGIKAPGIPYFLTSDGLTEQEFWQLANSLR